MLWQWPRSLGPLLLSLYAHSTWPVRGASESKSVLCHTKILINVCDRFQILEPKSKAREHISFCGQGGVCPWYALTSKTSSMPRFKGSINAAINADDSYTTVVHVKFRCFVSNHVWKSKKSKIAHGRFLDALASLDFKLSLSQWVLRLAHLRVFQSYFKCVSSIQVWALPK